MEAMATGLPVVATRVGDVADLVIEGQTGFLVEQGNVDALARAIAAVASDPPLRRRFGANARRIALERMSSEAMVARYGALYEEVARAEAGPG
jgi:glycosyltransferase involved in cell wall biosynthesis